MQLAPPPLDRALERLTDGVGGPARRRVIVLLALVLALQSADLATLGAVGAKLETSLHIGNTQLGILASVTVLMGAIGAVPGGTLADRLSRTKLLQVTIVMWSAALLVSAASVSFGMLLVTRVALGGIVASAGPSIASLTGDYFAPRERARVYGFILAGEMFGGAFGFLVSGGLAGIASWRASFAVLALPGVLLAVAIRKLLPEPARGGASRLAPGATEIESDGASAPSDQHSLVQEKVVQRDIEPRPQLIVRDRNLRIARAVRYILSIPTNRVLILASSLGYFFLTGLQTFAVVYLKRHFGVGQAPATGLLALIVLFSILGAIGGGRLADRLLGRGRLTARVVLPAVAYLIATAAFVPGFAAKSLALAAPLYLVGALALASTNPPLDAARLDIVPSSLWGRAGGVRAVFQSIGQALAPFLFGFTSQQLGSGGGRTSSTQGLGAQASAQGLEYTFLIMLGVLLVSGLVMTRARRTYSRDVATAVASNEALS